MDINKIEKFLKDSGQPKFRLQQISKAVYQDGVSGFNGISNIPKDLRRLLEENISILSFETEKVLAAGDKKAFKALLRLKDGNRIETVLISPKPGDWSVCISSQSGCSLDCSFCATGRGGFKRNLTAEEITDQVLFWRQYLKKMQMGLKFTVVYMGMGEPFLNWENVEKSIRYLIAPQLFGFGSRAISVSTVGIPEGIEKMAEEFPQINLAVSLHFADDIKRNKFIPVNKKYNLADLRSTVQKYFKKTRRKIFIEYVLIDNVNDNPEDAEELARYLESIGDTYLLHVNLIRCNPTGEEKIGPANKEKTQKFKDYLLKNNINCTIRKSLGTDIQGACGQLAAGNSPVSS